jgi:diguanylate cyclase
MTTDMGRCVADVASAPPGNPALHWFDQIRPLLLATSLPPQPDVFDLLWRYVRDENHDLSLAVDTAITHGALDLAAVTALRRAHCGVVGRADFQALVGAAHDQAEALTHRIEAGRTDLAGQIIRNASNGSSLGRISFSAGVAGDRPDDDADSLVDRADKALYSAKRMGRDRVAPDRS